jgi:predicted nucleic acid-binding protein
VAVSTIGRDSATGVVPGRAAVPRASGRPEQLSSAPPTRICRPSLTSWLAKPSISCEHPETRAQRADTLALARTADPIPINEAIMIAWPRLVADCRAAGVQRMVKLTDALIAATAVEHGLPVVTQDADYEPIARARPALHVVNV